MDPTKESRYTLGDMVSFDDVSYGFKNTTCEGCKNRDKLKTIVEMELSVLGGVIYSFIPNCKRLVRRKVKCYHIEVLGSNRASTRKAALGVKLTKLLPPLTTRRP